LSRNQFLNGVAAVSAHEKAMVEGGTFTKASDNEVIHATLEAPHSADSTMSEAMIHVNGFALEVGEALFGFDGEFLHHRESTVVAKGVLHDALALFVCFRDLKATGEVCEAFSAAGAVMKRAFFVIRMKLGRDRMGRWVFWTCHGLVGATITVLVSFPIWK
jgi:hypothetical protein